MDLSKHCIRLFVDIKFDGLGNNVIEIRSNSGLDWYFHIMIKDEGMKYPLLVTIDDGEFKHFAILQKHNLERIPTL